MQAQVTITPHCFVAELTSQCVYLARTQPVLPAALSALHPHSKFCPGEQVRFPTPH